MKQLLGTFFLFLTVSGYSQSETYSLTYQSGTSNEINDVIETRDGNLVSVGRINNGNNDAFVVKTDVSGNIIWANSYGTNDFEWANAVVELPDSGYAFVVRSYTSGTVIDQILLIRVDKDGNEVWSKFISSATEDLGNDLVLTADSNLCIVGQRNAASSTNVIAIKVDLNGSIVWANEYDLPTTVEGKAVKNTVDGGLIIALDYGTSMGLIKLDGSGTLDWNKAYTATGGLIFTNDVCTTNDGGYMVVGSVSNVGSGAKDVVVLKTDGTGNVDWFNAYGGFYDDAAYSIVAQNNSYIIGGYSASYGNTSEDGLAILISNTGSIIWSTTHKNVYDANVNQLIPHSTGGYILGGFKANSASITNSSFWLSKLETTGTTSCEENQVVLTTAPLSYITSGAAPTITTTGTTISNPTLNISALTLTEVVDCEHTVVNTEIFHRVIGNGQDDRANGIKQTPDGGYVVVGNTSNGVWGSDDIVLIKLTAQGDTTWTKVFGGNGNDNADDVVLTSDGGYLICGQSFSAFATDNVLLIKTNVNGEEMWTRTYEGNDAHSIINTSDGGYVVSTNTSNDAGILKLNSTGNMQWHKSYDAGAEGNRIIEAMNGDYIIVSDNNSSSSNAYVTRVDTAGNVIWSKSYGGANQEGAKGIVELSNGDLIVVGSTKTYAASGFTDMLIMRLDGLGNLIWAKAINRALHERALDVIKSNLGFVVTGTGYSGNNTAAILEFDINGNLLWSRGFGNNFFDYGNSVIRTIDRGYAIAGYANDFSNGNDDFYIIKTDTLGNSTGCFDAAIAFASADITPVVSVESPTVSNFTFEYNDNAQETRGLNLVLDLAITDSLFATSVSCNGLSDGEIDLSVSGGFQPYSYNWSTGSSQQDEDGLAAGSYSVTITDAKGCAVTSGIDVTEPDVIVVNTSNTPTSCFGSGDGTATASVTGGTPPYSYLWNSGQQTQVAVGLFAGTQSVNVLDSNGCLGSNFTTVVQPTEVTATFNVTEATCGSSDGSVEVVPSGGTQPYSQSWWNGSTDSLLQNVSEGYHSVVITDGNGCTHLDSAQVETGVNPIDLCVVTVDDLGHNLLVWEKPVVDNVSGYNIYRNISGAYSLIGFHPYDSLSQYSDQSFGVDPNVTSYRYRISAVDTCGNESTLSDFHETIHLTTNIGSQGEVNLIWDDYEGISFTSYNILVDVTNSGNYTSLANISSGNFTWTDLVPTTLSADYVVEIQLNSTCISTKANHNSTRSNVSRPGIIGTSIGENGLSETVSIYPNPTTDILNIHTSANNWSYQVFDAAGRVVASEEQIGANLLSINIDNWRKGIYLVQLNINGQSLNQRIVKN